MPRKKAHANGAVDDSVAVPRGTGEGVSWRARAAAANEWERQHEAEWERIDEKLRSIAARRAGLDGEEANLLRYAEELKLWRGWGFGSMLEYMERVMGYAPHTAAERLRVARALAELPLVAEALERGQLAHSAVREISRVAVPETEAAWLEAAQGKALREIEAIVAGHKAGDLPSDQTEPRLHRRTITLELSPETYDVWRKLHALAAEEHCQRLSDDELIQSLFRRAYGNGASSRCEAPATSRDLAAMAPPAADLAALRATAAMAPPAADLAQRTPSPNALCTSLATPAPDTSAVASASAVTLSSSPAYKIALKQCPDCGRAWQYTGGRDIEVDPAVLELAACDAVHLGSLDAAVPERATTTVTPRKREQVLARDGHRCTVPGCRRNVGLDLHHVEYQHRGGGHELSNLTTLCDLHHRAVHFEKLAIRGAAPDRLTYEFRRPRDRRNVTDDDAPPRTTPGPSSITRGSPGDTAPPARRSSDEEEAPP